MALSSDKASHSAKVEGVYWLTSFRNVCFLIKICFYAISLSFLWAIFTLKLFNERVPGYSHFKPQRSETVDMTADLRNDSREQITTLRYAGNTNFFLKFDDIIRSCALYIRGPEEFIIIIFCSNL